jgi:tetratricopeptide (TPR) repeat protein
MESCLEDPEMIQDAELMIPIGFDLCSSCMLSGNWQRVKHVAPTIIRLIERCRTKDQFFGKPFNTYAYVLAQWGISTAGCGDFVQGEILLQKALSFARENDHAPSEAFVEMTYGALLISKGDWQSAVEHLQNSIKHLEESQFMLILGVAWAWLGWALALTGRGKTAVDLAEKGVKMHTDLGMPFWRSACHYPCSCAHYQVGDVEEARRHADLALRFSIENNERQCEGVSRAWLGRVVPKTSAGEIEAAEQQVLKGISVLEDLGIRSNYALGYLWLGEVYAESGRREQALANIKKAEGMFRDMGMDYWLCKAQEALARL